MADTSDNATSEKDGAAEELRARTARLRWTCRRGMRELDVVLQRYLENRYPAADAVERQAFETLLELQDPQLFAYLLGSEVPTDPQWTNVVARLTRVGS